MDPPVTDTDKIEDQKDKGPSFHCVLYDTEVVHKIAQAFLPGLATACVDNTTGDIFRSPGSVAAEIRKEMIDYMTQRSETFVAEHIVLEGGSEVESSHEPYDIISDFIDDFATMKRNLFSRVSGWLLSERREDNIDDFAQEMEISGFWLTDQREAIAQILLKNVDFRNICHCKMKYETEAGLNDHVMSCGYRSMNCENEGCSAVFSASSKDNHDSVCPFKIILCEQNCSESIMRREMDRHCITLCPMKLVNCPFYSVGCLVDVHQCELQQHQVDNVGSHVMFILRSIYKEASIDDLKPRADQIQEMSSQIAAARNARSLTNLVKETDAKLGPLKIKPKAKPKKEEEEEEEEKSKDKTGLESENSKKKAEIKAEEEKVESIAKESEVLVDATTMVENVKKVSEAEIAENVNEEGEIKAQKLLEMGEFIKESEQTNNNNNSVTETKAPEVVLMAASDAKESRTDPLQDTEKRGNDSDKAEAEVEALSKSRKGFNEAKNETEPNMS